MWQLPTLILAIASICIAAPGGSDRACGQCTRPAIGKTEFTNDGTMTMTYSYDRNGCAVIKLTCKGTPGHQQTYIDFNNGETGILGQGAEQEAELLCSSKGVWTFKDTTSDIAIDVVSCEVI